MAHPAMMHSGRPPPLASSSKAAKVAAQTAEKVTHLHNTNPRTLTRFMLEASSAGTRSSNTDLALIINAISVSAKVIANAVAMTGIDSLHKVHSGSRSHAAGDEQKELDLIAHDVMVNALASSQRVAIMCSEEHADPIFCRGATGEQAYAVAFDPLDGSSNIECNVSVGTIFGIYNAGAKPSAAADFLRAGTDLVCAGYVLYSSSVIIVLSTGVGVHSFTLDPTFGEFIESSNNPILIPKEPRKIFSVNAGNELAWDQATADFVSWTKTQDDPYSLRYIGSMVSDVHRTILYGGIFMYPADRRNKSGKLRLLYECFPMAFLMEAAGGLASTGRGRILDLVPANLHERSPIFLGCKRDVTILEGFYARMDGMALTSGGGEKTTAPATATAPTTSPSKRRRRLGSTGSSGGGGGDFGGNLGGPSISKTCDAATDVLWGEYIMQREASSSED